MRNHDTDYIDNISKISQTLGAMKFTSSFAEEVHQGVIKIRSYQDLVRHLVITGYAKNEPSYHLEHERNASNSYIEI